MDHSLELLELLTEPALIVTPEGKLVRANGAFRKFAKLPGVAENEASSIAGDPEEWRDFVRTCSEAKQTTAGNVSLRLPDGSSMRLHCESAPLNIPGERPLLFLRCKPGESGHERVTLLKEKIEQLQNEVNATQALGHLAAIVESSDDAIVSKTLTGVVTTWNQAAERLFGYSADEMIGQHITKLFPPGLAEDENMILGRIKAGHRLSNYETVRQRKDGSLVDVSLTVSPIKDDTGRIIGASKIARDISRQKRIDRELAEAQEQLRSYAETLEARVRSRTAQLQETVQSLDSFCYTIAHDLRAPLRALSGFSREVLDHYAALLDGEGQDALKRIAGAAARMDQLILDLLRLGRVSTAELTAEVVDLREATHRVLGALEPEIRSRQAIVQVGPSMLPISANPVLLEQILLNLLNNALKFARPDIPPEIHVYSQQAGNTVRVCVQDNGIGIKTDHVKKLFQPFQRLVSADQYSGTGIGLAIVRKAAERMGGRAGVQSQPGKGSLFWVELPGATVPHDAAIETPPARTFTPQELKPANAYAAAPGQA
jgi:PAS domain S-box-containing protein